MKRKFFERTIGTVLAIFIVIGSLVFITQAGNEINKDNKTFLAFNEQNKEVIDSPALDTDTVQDVQDGASNTINLIENTSIALNEANAVCKRIRNDKDTASKLLALAKAKDNAGIVALLKRDAPQSQIEVVEIEDWKATFSFTVKGIKIRICGSNENRCNGGKASIVFN